MFRPIRLWPPLPSIFCMSSHNALTKWPPMSEDEDGARFSSGSITRRHMLLDVADQACSNPTAPVATVYHSRRPLLLMTTDLVKILQICTASTIHSAGVFNKTPCLPPALHPRLIRSQDGTDSPSMAQGSQERSSCPSTCPMLSLRMWRPVTSTGTCVRRGEKLYHIHPPSACLDPAMMCVCEIKARVRQADLLRQHCTPRPRLGLRLQLKSDMPAAKIRMQ